MTRLLSVAEVAERTSIKVSTFYTWRAMGTGPRSFKLNGRVVYDEAELNRWLEAQAAETSRGGSA